MPRKDKKYADKSIDPINRLINVFSETQSNKEWMVPLGEAYSPNLEGNLVGRTLVINGPAQSGKTSLVYWALRYDYG